MDPLTTYWKAITSMRRLRENAERVAQPFCVRHSITGLQLRILLALYFDGPQTVSSLANITCMAGANSSAQCKKLAADGLVCRKRNPEDERNVDISLSEKGEQTIKEFTLLCTDMLGVVNPQLDGHDVSAIIGILDKINNALEQDRAKEKTT